METRTCRVVHSQHAEAGNHNQVQRNRLTVVVELSKPSVVGRLAALLWCNLALMNRIQSNILDQQFQELVEPYITQQRVIVITLAIASITSWFSNYLIIVTEATNFTLQ